MLELVLGGARSGKSRMAEEKALSSGKKLVYIATARAGDAEMAQRIAHHQSRRGKEWQTIEAPLELAEVLVTHAAEDVCIVVDCLSLWLSNLLCDEAEDIDSRKNALLSALSDLPGHIIFVCNSVGMGIVPLGELSRQFVDQSGWLEQTLAQRCQVVTFVVAGLPMVLKDKPV